MNTDETPPVQEGAPNLEALLPVALGDTLTRTFRCMELAEDEIAKVKRRHPGQAAALDDAFRHLMPTPVLRGLGDEVYGAHCREILELLATGDDIREGTTAEVIAALAESSQAAPLTRTATLLYIELFELVFPGKSEKLFAELGPMEPNAYERTQMRELEADLRRKLRTDRGFKRDDSAVREPSPAYGREAAFDAKRAAAMSARGCAPSVRFRFGTWASRFGPRRFAGLRKLSSSLGKSSTTTRRNT